MEGFDSGYGFAYRRQKIDSKLPYLVANETSLYLRNTDGQNNYELRLDGSGLVIYNNDVPFIEIDTNNKISSGQQKSLLYDVSNLIQQTDNKNYFYLNYMPSTGDTSGYTKYYGDTYYFTNTDAALLPNVSNADLYLTPEGNLVATNSPKMLWANGRKVLQQSPFNDISNGQFIEKDDNYFEYIKRDGVYVFEHYTLNVSQNIWELTNQNTYDIPSKYINNDILHAEGGFGVDKDVIYIGAEDDWKWANGYDISNTLVSGTELRVNGFLCNGPTKLQLKNDGLYLNGKSHIQFKSKFATSMKLENGNLFVVDNNGTTIWNLNTGPGKATELKISNENDNTLYLTDGNVKWTIYPDASYNFSTEDTSEYENKKRDLKDIQTKHSGSDERYANTVSTYYREMINTFNLGIGLIAGTIVIFKSM